MADGRISSFISEEGKQELADLIVKLQSAADKIKEINQNRLRISADTSGTDTIVGLANNTRRLQQNTDELSLAMREYQRIANQQVVLQARLDAGTSEQARAVATLRQETNSLNAAMREEARLAQAAEGSLNAMRAQLNLLTRQYDALSKAERESAQNGQLLLRQIQDQSREIMALEAATSRHQRNVGNYAGAFNGLQMSINQVTREMPAFVNSTQTGFMAISNNLPILFDNLKNLRAQNAALAAEGKPTESALKQLGTAVFSLGTALSVGITLLTLYGPKLAEWVGSLFESKKAIDQATLAKENLNKALESSEYTTAISQLNELKENVELAKQGFISKERVVNQYNETLGKTIGQSKDLDDVERKLIESGDAYVKMTLYKAAANLALQEAAKKAFEVEKTRQKTLEDFAKGTDEVNRAVAGFSRTESGMVHQREVMDKVEQTVQQNRKKRKDDEIKTNEDAKNKLINIAKDFQKQAAEIAKQSGFDFFGGEHETKQPKKKKIDLTPKVEDLESVHAFANDLSTIVKAAIEPPKDMVATWQRAFDELDRIAQKNREKQAKKDEQLQKQIAQRRLDIEKQIANNLLGLFETALNAQYQKQLDALTERQKAVDDTYNQEIAMIEASAKSDQQKSELKMQYEAKAAAQKRQLEKEEADIKRKQAENDKIAALASIAINTAVAITKAYAESTAGGIALTPYLLALGVTEAAIVMATPLPQYYKGTDNAPEGYAWTGERGTEMRINPDGTIEFTPDHATVQYLEAGTQIITAEETSRILKSLAQPFNPKSKDRESMDFMEALDIHAAKIVKALNKNKPVVNIHNDAVGWQLYVASKTRRR